eukprot:jgi/Psemu1/311416/fgenesh1_kg.767_\
MKEIWSGSAEKELRRTYFDNHMFLETQRKQFACTLAIERYSSAQFSSWSYQRRPEQRKRE